MWLPPYRVFHSKTGLPGKTQKPGWRKEAGGVDDELGQDEFGTIENEPEHSKF